MWETSKNSKTGSEAIWPSLSLDCEGGPQIFFSQFDLMSKHFENPRFSPLLSQCCFGAFSRLFSKSDGGILNSYSIFAWNTHIISRFNPNNIKVNFNSVCTYSTMPNPFHVIKKHHRFKMRQFSKLRGAPERNEMEGGFFSSFFTLLEKRGGGGGEAFPFFHFHHTAEQKSVVQMIKASRPGRWCYRNRFKTSIDSAETSGRSSVWITAAKHLRNSSPGHQE